MIFNSVPFLLFFILTTALFFIFPHKFRWLLLLLASSFFYMFFKPEYILILLFTITVDYFAGILIEQSGNQLLRKLLLVSSLVANIGILLVFKYFNFFNDTVTGLGQIFDFHNHIPHWNIILPIGLSFHTFQAMSYTIEVYRKNFPAEKHFGLYALYVMFYPQLVAGPIERPQHIIPQFRIEKYFNYENAVIGLNLIFWGLFKKIVIADRLAIYVNHVYGDIDGMGSISVLLSVFFFSFQIYCDFSGYSDIARGTARIMGYELVINFNKPYISQSFAEFWSRWHISLSSWLRDYLYIPLGGNRNGTVSKYRNLLIVFFISGLWHGANTTFLIWGLLHAFYMILEDSLLKIRKLINPRYHYYGKNNIVKYLKITIIFTLVSLAWIFFRAANLSDAKLIFSKLIEFRFSFNLAEISAFEGPLNLILCFLSIFFILVSRNINYIIDKTTNISLAVCCTFLIILLGPNDSGQFIYFQF